MMRNRYKLLKLFCLIFMGVSTILVVTKTYAFVGGAHGGFSGGGYSGGYAGGGYHGTGGSHDYSSESHSFIKAISIFGVLLFILTFYLCLKNMFYQTKFGKIYFHYQQKKYIKKCRHTPKNPRHVYSSFELEDAIQKLQHKAMSDVKEISYLSEVSHNQLAKKAIDLFKELQKEWSMQHSNKVLRACSNTKYSTKLCEQISKMQSMGVYNFIDDTEITECHLVKSYKPRFSKTTILCFALKGMQVDEYTTKKYYINSGKFKRRQFNCWLNVVPYQDNFKVYQIKIDKHVDDYVLKEAK